MTKLLRSIHSMKRPGRVKAMLSRPSEGPAKLTPPSPRQRSCCKKVGHDWSVDIRLAKPYHALTWGGQEDNSTLECKTIRLDLAAYASCGNVGSIMIRDCRAFLKGLRTRRRCLSPRVKAEAMQRKRPVFCSLPIKFIVAVHIILS